MSNYLDADGQPPRQFYAGRVEDRLIAELLGVCKGIICDGVVNDDEAISLRAWIRGHPDVVVQFPGNVLYERLLRTFENGEIDGDERIELEEMLRDLVGDDIERDTLLNGPTRLAYDDPLPVLTFRGWEYVFTGKFAAGTRRHCERAVLDRGGFVAATLTGRTKCLVVGSFASDAWIQSAYGTKILDAVERREAGHAIHIVPESHWVAALRLA